MSQIASHCKKEGYVTKVAVLGSGNGGHAVAFDFARNGFEVYMCDFEAFPANIAAIAEQGGVFSDGEMEGFQKITYAGHSFETSVKDADVVLVVATANAVIPFAEACKPYIHKGQIFIVCPGSCFGGIEFKRALGFELDDDEVTVAETSTLPYAARITKPGSVHISNRLKGGYWIAALPKSKTPEVLSFITKVYDKMEAAESILKTSLQNGNPAIHPAVMICNVARTENKMPWLFYQDGVTTGVGRIIKAVDDERIQFGKFFGIEIMDDPSLGLIQGYMYNATYDEGYVKAPGFAGIMAPTTTDHRYFDEDVNGLCLWEDIGKYLGVPTTTITSEINIANVIRNKDYRAVMTKSVSSLGLDKWPPEEIAKNI